MYNISIKNKRKPMNSSIRQRDFEDNFTDLEWNRIYCHRFRAVRESKLNWLQFQILEKSLSFCTS